ncbi:MAG: lipid-A-disaccharide synthase [Rickettsiales bacterium]|jgi:lipid-A-disaccharide synthase|nr:lipid-A-disaccharide synthase [Rickettsiales bacterium]
MKKKIFVVAGEKSGDVLGSKILEQLDKDTFEVSGIGGEMMEKRGLRSLFSMNELSVMGLFEVLPKIFKLLTLIKKTAEYIVNTEQDILFTIDSPSFCFRVAKLVKKLSKNKKIKLVHFIAPSVWVYKADRAGKIAKIYDLLFCILPFEPPYFEKYGLKTVFVGHPIFDKESIEYGFNGDEIMEYNRNSNIISITVGSRKSELKILLPIVLKVIKKLKDRYENLRYFILATDYTYDIIQNELKIRDINYISVEKNVDKKNRIIKDSLFSIAKSGTNTLEIAGYSIPMIVIYKFGFLTNKIARLMKITSKTKFVNLINVLNQRDIIPEFTLDNCTVANIFEMSCRFVEDEYWRLRQVKENIKTLELLGYKQNNSSTRIIVNHL